LPSLISASLAPGPYWPAAYASPPARKRLAADSADEVICFGDMISSAVLFERFFCVFDPTRACQAALWFVGLKVAR
jgi:hypothetical protein